MDRPIFTNGTYKHVFADIIVPIFNKLTPLEDGELRSKIEKYSMRLVIYLRIFT